MHRHRKIVTGVEDEGGGRLRKNQGGESGSTASQSLRNGICFDRWDQLGWGVKHSRRWEGEFDSVSISWLSVLNQRMGFKDCLPGNFMDTTEIACPNHRRQPPEGCTRRKNCTRSIDCVSKLRLWRRRVFRSSQPYIHILLMINVSTGRSTQENMENTYRGRQCYRQYVSCLAGIGN